jgi:hypothetical protein
LKETEGLGVKRRTGKGEKGEWSPERRENGKIRVGDMYCRYPNKLRMKSAMK